MSLRTSRRSQQAGAQLVGVPSAPISEIRTRKWTKQLKTVGHLIIPKWVPGRKRQTAEIGRMTRSVRQHLDAPLELLSEYPAIRQSHGPRQATPSTLAPPTALPANASAPVAQAQALVAPSVPATDASGAIAGGAATGALAQQQPAQTAVAINQVAQVQDASTNSMPQGSEFMQLAASSGDPLLAQTVPSDEQLEMALEDLPMLDSDEDLPFDQLMEDQVPPVSAPAAAPAATVASPAAESAEEHGSISDAVDNTAESTADDDEDSDSSSSEDDDDESANSGGGSPMPSPSPQSSPVPSRSPSP